jgi:hypothetical protein
MTDADLIALAEREQARLTTDGDTCAAAIIRALVDRIKPTAKPEDAPITWDILRRIVYPAKVVEPAPDAPKPTGWGPQIPVSSDGPPVVRTHIGTGFPAA